MINKQLLSYPFVVIFLGIFALNSSWAGGAASSENKKLHYSDSIPSSSPSPQELAAADAEKKARDELVLSRAKGLARSKIIEAVPNYFGRNNQATTFSAISDYLKMNKASFSMKLQGHARTIDLVGNRYWLLELPTAELMLEIMEQHSDFMPLIQYLRLSPETIPLFRAEDWPNLRFLSLANCGLDRVPEWVRSLNNLEQLNLSLNKGIDFASYDLPLNLKELNIAYCGLSTIPWVITRCKKLEKLYVEIDVLAKTPKKFVDSLFGPESLTAALDVHAPLPSLVKIGVFVCMLGSEYDTMIDLCGSDRAPRFLRKVGNKGFGYELEYLTNWRSIEQRFCSIELNTFSLQALKILAADTNDKSITFAS